MFVKFFQLSEKFGALQKGQGDVSAPPPTSYHIKLNEIYQIDSRAVDCQILLKKCDESIVTKWYKLYLIHVTKKNVLGHLMRVFSFRSLWRSWKREVEEKKLDMMRMIQKEKGTGEMMELGRKRMPFQCSSILVIRSLILED